MTKVYIVEGCRLSVKPLIKETEKSFIVEMRYAHNGRYAQPKRRYAQHINATDVKYANTTLATLDAHIAKQHLQAQFEEVASHHQDRITAAWASAITGFADLLLNSEGQSYD